MAKPALVTSNVNIARSVWGAVLRWTNVGASVSIEELAAAMVSEAVLKPGGFDRDEYSNDELRKIGRAVLDGQAASASV